MPLSPLMSSCGRRDTGGHPRPMLNDQLAARDLFNGHA